jgi:hypothetical protein
MGLNHSITSSARASSVAGTSRPSALAVLRLITLQNAGDVVAGQAITFDDAGSVADQTA